MIGKDFVWADRAEFQARNSDFRKRQVHFEVEGKVDYAEIEVFYPAEASNHPRSGQLRIRTLLRSV